MPFDRKTYDKKRVKSAEYREYQRKQKYRWRMLKRQAAGLPVQDYEPNPAMRKGMPSYEHAHRHQQAEEDNEE